MCNDNSKIQTVATSCFSVEFYTDNKRNIDCANVTCHLM